MSTPFLEMKKITRSFPGVVALDHVDITVEKGEVMGLIGENGAGKSTLMKILTGVLSKDEGEIVVDGKSVLIDSPQDAKRYGISIIYQELNILKNLDIAENIFLGKEEKKGLFIDTAGIHHKTKILLRRVGLEVSTHTLVGNLSIAQQQMVEVARALSFKAKLIVMDEPTSSLTDKEVAILLRIIRKLKSEGVSTIFISHRLNEVFDITDSITIMRDGKKIRKLFGKEINHSYVVNMMVGREIGTVFVKEEAAIGRNILEVKKINTKDLIEDVSFCVKEGEIVGFSGLVGAGRTEVMNAIFGIDAKTSGEIFIDGKKVDIKSPLDAVAAGIGFVTEDRKNNGLVLGMSVMENITLSYLKSLSKLDFIDNKAEIKAADFYIHELSIKTPTRNQLVENLSGGNQQKVVIAKWLMNNPRILIMDEPTRGIDIGAKKEVHRLMSELAGKGIAIILISSELPEVIGMSDRIIVMNEGRIKGELARKDATQEKIMSLAILESKREVIYCE